MYLELMHSDLRLARGHVRDLRSAAKDPRVSSASISASNPPSIEISNGLVGRSLSEVNEAPFLILLASLTLWDLASQFALFLWH